MVRRPPRSTRTDTLVPYTTLCRAVFVVAARGHAADELLAEGMDGADALEGRHGAAQAVGLGRREAGGDDGDLHGLFLEQRHAEGLLQHLPQLLGGIVDRSEEHTSELQSLMRISYAVFCLKKKTKQNQKHI